MPSAPREILAELLADNEAYVNGKSQPQSVLSSAEVRTKLSTGQAPVVAIVTCADSRVGPEIVYGAGIGRLFVIRNAGNMAIDDSVVGSIEYAVCHLNVPLVMIMGHTKCGAITAAVNAVKAGGGGAPGTPLEKHVTAIANVVKPCVGGDDEVPKAIDFNVRDNVEKLRAGSSPLAQAFASGKAEVVGCVYDIESGLVKVLD